MTVLFTGALLRKPALPRIVTFPRPVMPSVQASAFVLFPSLKAACDAVLPLKQHKVAVAVELHDFSSLR